MCGAGGEVSFSSVMDISAITDYLLVGSQPRPSDAEQLRARGVRLLISLRAWRRPAPVFNQPPMRALWLRAVDSPFTPISLGTLTTGVEAALEVIREGGGVFVHCKYGRHRSVAMAAAVLIALGDPAEAAMQRLTLNRQRAEPHIWYIRQQIVRFERHWLNERGSDATGGARRWPSFNP